MLHHIRQRLSDGTLTTLALVTYQGLSREVLSVSFTHTGKTVSRKKLSHTFLFTQRYNRIWTHHDAAHTAVAEPTASASTSVALAAAPVCRRGVHGRVAKRPQHVQRTRQPHGRVVVRQNVVHAFLVRGLQQTVIPRCPTCAPTPRHVRLIRGRVHFPYERAQCAVTVRRHAPALRGCASCRWSRNTTRVRSHCFAALSWQ